ncbi:hypothetical protein [Schumannella soli]|uniref:Uncharacterized protein n=1 Tax=Schumannella soli TaxID=2590779 RepID=A0A506Y1Q7_9MICO|nr:hypothetical protein [Schumannella soli]TPW75902.1 hypothetical protein FJ657_08625 [Schumannella soli]
MDNGDGTVTFTATSWHDSILPQPLRFAPPFADLSPNPESQSRFWQFMRYAFDLPDPARFPPFTEAPAARDLRAIDRFIQSARELATYSALSGEASVSYSFADGKGEFTSSFGPPEALRGTTVLFRQLYAGSDDKGNFRAMLAILSEAHKRDTGRDFDLRADILRDWRKAHGALMQEVITVIVDKAVLAREGAHPDVFEMIPDLGVRPTEVISNHFYGDLIHWGKSAGRLETLREQSAMMADIDKFRFIGAMGGLAYFYMGWAILLAAAFRRPLE